MTATAGQNALYPTRSGAGSTLGRQLNQRVRKPVIVWGITPSGVEIAATAAEAMKCLFDVVVTSTLRVEGVGVVGAIAEDAKAVFDPVFKPTFDQVEAVDEALDRSRRVIKQERLLFRGQRVLHDVTGACVVVVDAQVTSPWKVLAAADCAEAMKPAQIVVAVAVCTQPVQERLRARRLELVCPTVVMDPNGHPNPFGDPQDASAERLKSIVIARHAA
ncbi:MAG: hypothetical protein IIA27_02600 [Gemmatimonadetes bacterium]|nr:hypothetical protein [Gemmatimonadota bacterium]